MLSLPCLGAISASEGQRFAACLRKSMMPACPGAGVRQRSVSLVDDQALLRRDVEAVEA